MEDRRTFLALATAALMVPIEFAETGAQTAAPRPAADLARYPLTGPFEGYEAVLTEVKAAAGQPGAPASGRGHRHSGFVLGYVLEGRLRFAINNEPEKIVEAGGTFFEPIGALHSSSGATPDGPVRFLAFLVVPKGAPVVVPA
jgi:quercetin dioxygenase-like cupin family protein